MIDLSPGENHCRVLDTVLVYACWVARTTGCLCGATCSSLAALVDPRGVGRARQRVLTLTGLLSPVA